MASILTHNNKLFFAGYSCAKNEAPKQIMLAYDSRGATARPSMRQGTISETDPL
jgi:hypothetical protein